MWRCPECGRELQKTDQHHFCEPMIKTIDDYIAAQPEERQEVLQRVRETIKAAAPEAVECIKWRMPTFYQNENLIHFACHRNHLGLYPGDSGVSAFSQRLAAEGYKSTKGAIQFPWRNPIPFDLIAEITRYRVKEATGKEVN